MSGECDAAEDVLILAFIILFNIAVKCYQCAYSPGKTTYKEIHVPVTVEDPYDPYKKKVEYRIKKVTKSHFHKNCAKSFCAEFRQKFQ